MKKNSLLSVCAFTAVIVLFHALPVPAAPGHQQQDDSPKVSEGEAKAITAFNAAADPAAKLKLAEEFAKKYPKSSVLPQVERKAAVEIAKSKDPNQKLALADKFEKAFKDDQALTIVQGARLDSLIALKRIDDAFTLAGTVLTKNPDELHTLMQVSFAGTEEAKRGNGKYMQQSMKYGLKAIELIEAGNKPVNMDEATWAAHKAALPQLYQHTGILAMVSKDPVNAKARISKSIELNPTDPTGYAIMAIFINNEYIQLATDYKAMPEGKEKAAQFVKLQGMIDGIIDSYAHAVALATDKPEHQSLVQQVMPDLTSYYKYRHNQSTEGLQELIDKYKPQKP
jgi:hypothetical protein